MAQWVRPNNLNLIPRTHTVEEDTPFLKGIFWKWWQSWAGSVQTKALTPVLLSESSLSHVSLIPLVYDSIS